MAEISVRDVVKKFGETTALDGVSLTVRHGEVLALLGPSGCGKTTMLRCIAGLEEPSSGTIELGEETLFSARGSVPPWRRDIGMVFQSYALWPHLTVAQNVGYGLTVQRTNKKVLARRVAETLELTGLTGLEGRYPGELSGGQQQRVAVARALALHAEVVLFDEPLSNLDLKLREGVRDELKRVLAEFGVTAVYVTHDVGEAVVLADRIAVMHAGQIVQLGTPDEIYHQPATEYVARFVGNVNVLTARVERSGDARVVVVGDALRLDNPRLLARLPAGATDVRLLVRPEYVDLDVGGGGFGHEAVVKEIEFLGQATSYTVDLSGVLLRAVGLSRPDTKLTAGSVCTVRFAPEHVVVAGPDGEGGN
ncbi:ABC transporter ATP-binding protein [Actinophytocola sp.]|uniref:ABC transporter ATP-binding protein n=1 Tax=Actinophytocola sp. TaxID=1872138 RepID=UPI003D6C5EE4